MERLLKLLMLEIFLCFIFKVIEFAVATGFPAGQTPLKTRLDEISQAVQDGATEIDVVINRQYALSANWRSRYWYL